MSASSSWSFGGPRPDPLEHLRGDRRVQRRLAGGHAAHRVDEVVAAHLLEDVAGRTGHDRGEQRVVVVVRREDERLDARVLRAHVPAHVDARAVGQTPVEDRDVRTERRDPARGLLGETGLPHDHDVALGLQQLPDTATHELVVVEQVDPDGLGGGLGRGLGCVCHSPTVAPTAFSRGGLIGPHGEDLGPCTSAPVGHTVSTTRPGDARTILEQEFAMLVKDVMTHDPVTVAEDTPVKVAIAHLARHRITAMPVLTRSGRLCGVVSEADLIRDLVSADPRAHELPLDDEPWHDRPCVVGDVMTPHAVTVEPDTELARAVELITSTSVKSVPVVDATGRVVGMLSRGDVVQMLARADADLEGEVDALLTSVGIEGWYAEVSDGTVSLAGPEGSASEGLARLVAGTVPGVVEVHVDAVVGRFRDERAWDGSDPMTRSPAPEELRRIVELASRAPSIHNTQPWRWQRTDEGVELHADWSRQLHLTDPMGRNLVISCGAALHHTQVAAGALGWRTDVHRVPDGPASHVLARITLRPASPSEQADSDLRAINDRCTDRRRFTSWPVPDERLQHLANIAAGHGVQAVPLLGVSERFRAEMLVGRAVERQAADPRYANEQAQWIDHGACGRHPVRCPPAGVVDQFWCTPQSLLVGPPAGP